MAWTLTVEDPAKFGFTITVHPSKKAALLALATEYDPDGTYAASENGDLLAGLARHTELIIDIDQHT